MAVQQLGPEASRAGARRARALAARAGGPTAALVALSTVTVTSLVAIAFAPLPHPVSPGVGGGVAAPGDVRALLPAKAVHSRPRPAPKDHQDDRLVLHQHPARGRRQPTTSTAARPAARHAPAAAAPAHGDGGHGAGTGNGSGNGDQAAAVARPGPGGDGSGNGAVTAAAAHGGTRTPTIPPTPVCTPTRRAPGRRRRRRPPAKPDLRCAARRTGTTAAATTSSSRGRPPDRSDGPDRRHRCWLGSRWRRHRRAPGGGHRRGHPGPGTVNAAHLRGTVESSPATHQPGSHSECDSGLGHRAAGHPRRGRLRVPRAAQRRGTAGPSGRHHRVVKAVRHRPTPR